MSFASDALFAEVREGVAADPSLVTKIKGVYVFNITGGPGGAKKEWTIDLKNGSGSVIEGKGFFFFFLSLFHILGRPIFNFSLFLLLSFITFLN
jgi:hypothetical protein